MHRAFCGAQRATLLYRENMTMQYYKQLVKHSDNENGDCFRTCIANMLDMHPEHVPHFFAACVSDPWKYVTDWMKQHGRQMIFVPFHAPDAMTVRSIMPHVAPDVYYMLMGEDKSGMNHAVVCINSNVEFDPSWTDVGVHRPLETGEFFVGMFIDTKFCKP